jgi:CheY-like chemotaxis protein
MFNEINPVVLLVEDNDGHAQLIALGMKDSGIEHDMIRVSDGIEAMNYLLKKGVYADNKYRRPDLILLDLRLPKMDGLEVLKVIKSDETLKEIPVVVLTTSESKNDLTTAYDYHVNSYLVKPMHYEEMSLMLQETGFYWLTCNKRTG